MCFYYYTDSPSWSLFYAAHDELCVDCSLLKKDHVWSWWKQWVIQGAFINETAVSTSNGFRRTYLVVFALLKGKLHGGHSQLVGEEAHVSWQLRGADVGSGAVPTTHAAQQLSLGSGEPEGTHISVVWQYCVAHGRTMRKTDNRHFHFWVNKQHTSGRSRETTAGMRGRREMTTLSHSWTRFQWLQSCRIPPFFRVQPLSRRLATRFTAVYFFFLPGVSPGAGG